MICGAVVNIVLEAPLFDAPGFLIYATHYSRQIGFAAVLGLITEAIWGGIAVTCSSRHRPHRHSSADLQSRDATVRP